LLAEALTQNYYEVLGVPRTATADEVRTAYILLVKACHPDRLGTSPDPSEWKAANTQLSEANAAFAVLGDPARRKQYDAALDDDGNNHKQAGTESRAEQSSPNGNHQNNSERMYVIVTGNAMRDRAGVIKALLDNKVITSYYSNFNNCLICTSRGSANDLSNAIVKHLGASDGAVFLVAEATGEVNGRLPMRAWDFIRKNTSKTGRGWS
jgi:curved DNA-binding protein CbpA